MPVIFGLMHIHLTQCSLGTTYGNIDQVNIGLGNGLLIDNTITWTRLLINELLGHSSESNFTASSQASISV